MKKTALVASLIAMLPMGANADLLFTVGAKASSWSAEPSGQFDEGVDATSTENGLGLGDDNGTQLTLYFEHPVLFVPNVRVRQTSLELTGSGMLSASFADETFNEEVASTLDMAHTDLTLYWGLPIPVPFFDFNFGLTARMFDGGIEVVGESADESVDFDFALPLAYGEVQVSTPFGIYGQVEVNYIDIDGNSINDMSYGIGYDLPLPVVDLGLEVGYRSFSMTTNEDTIDIATDFEVSGMYYGASFSVGL